ncbi:Hypothetical predicted protein [Pelobates cultripes]|uniref:Uncharacterized protein n=1 Tax=Pelobates cultripes TaxID=61616 RepID=A0AAD1T214_PELCU|nr:Hypothetical predicted protein [Pelobates cultripes]
MIRYAGEGLASDVESPRPLPASCHCDWIADGSINLRKGISRTSLNCAARVEPFSADPAYWRDDVESPRLLTMSYLKTSVCRRKKKEGGVPTRLTSDECNRHAHYQYENKDPKEKYRNIYNAPL